MIYSWNDKTWEYGTIGDLRLMQFTFRDVTEKVVGWEMTDKIFYEAGKLAGMEFYEHFMGSVKELPEFIRQLQVCWKIWELVFCELSSWTWTKVN